MLRSKVTSRLSASVQSTSRTFVKIIYECALEDAMAIGIILSERNRTYEAGQQPLNQPGHSSLILAATASEAPRC